MPSILTDATNGFRNGLRRMTSGQLVDRPRPKGKENYPSDAQLNGSASPTFSSFDPHRWDPIDGTIVIKVSVPATDDIWRFKVPQNISLRGFRAKVELKVGFAVMFAESSTTHSRRITSEENFKRWTAGRVKDGRNRPLVALKKQYHTNSFPSTPTSPLSPTFSPSLFSPISSLSSALSPSPLPPLSPLDQTFDHHNLSF